MTRQLWLTDSVKTLYTDNGYRLNSLSLSLSLYIYIYIYIYTQYLCASMIELIFFVWQTVTQYCSSHSGSLIGHPVENLRVVLTDGAAHAVDSSELAFKMASIYAFRQVIFIHHLFLVVYWFLHIDIMTSFFDNLCCLV